MSDLGLGDSHHHTGQRSSRGGGCGCLPALVALALIVGIGLFAYVKGVDLIKGALSGPDDYAGDGHGSVVISVQNGETAAAIASTLHDADVVKSEQAFTDAAKADTRSLGIQAGCYAMHQQMSGASALALMLLDSSHVICPGVTQLTIPEGLRAQEILGRIVQHTELSRGEVDRTFKGAASLGLPSYAGGDPEGYLFPATYDVSKTTSASDLLTEMVAKFRTEARTLGLEAKAKALGVSPHDLVVVASLVQAEARRPQDMPRVASVIYNRLHDRMPLQFDSTLHYAVDSRGEIQTSQKLQNLESPYNTYKHTGLPPTAIDSPGAQAFEAALHPADTSYRYFVTVNLRTGETLFATTYAQHQRNVARYHRYCKTSDAC